jgi:hypothetical protein
MTFFALEEAGEVVELYLDYLDPTTGSNAQART